ncbi:MAG TPA: Flp family type IVb pilin [Xanthobacteraceae bacterium]|nr:Flp family type IVb pilin [Xanthobacteraceae bacterium]
MRRLEKFGSSLTRSAAALVQNRNGATAIEYAMIASGIAAAIVLAVTTLGTTTQGFYNSLVAMFK